jgi:GTP cyclohydrolase II
VKFSYEMLPEQPVSTLLEIVERVPIEIEPNGHNKRYLGTKREKLNHVFEKF